MIKSVFTDLFKLPSFVRLSAEMERKFQNAQRHSFVTFFRTALLFGMVAYALMILWDWIGASAVFLDILIPRVTMLLAFVIVLATTFHKKFYSIGRYVGVLFILGLMMNVIWIQGLIEKGLEEGYGMLITPGATTSVIVFSGAEMGYGALLTPLLLLPLGFTAMQAFIVSALVIITVNMGMSHSDLPSAFVQTANSVFISIGVFTTILAYLVTQHRRAAFLLEHNLRIARDEAEEASAAKSNFLATMSHEVRTPLNGILGMASLLLQTQLNEKQEDYLQTVKYSGEALLSMLNDILDFSKMEAGKFEIEKIDIDFDRLIHSVADLMCSRAEEQGIVIRVEIKDDVPKYIHSDPTRLRQVLLNLLSNAIKFTERGHVMVAVSNQGEKEGDTLLRFEVIDTGIGISEEAQKNLFREFTQADSSTSRKYGGTGLGLSICQRIVELLDGAIQVKSTDGDGSTFWFEIPVGFSDGASLNVTEAKEVIPNLEPLHILLADDNKINAQIASDFLRTQDHEIHVASDGLKAVNAMKILDFDIVLMDMQMPNMDGLEATQEIKSWGNEKSEVPIIALTANNMQADIDRCTDAGMVGHITKPFSKAILFKTIAEHLPDKILETPEDTAENIDNIEGTDNMDLSALQELEETFDRDYVLDFLQKYLPTIEEYVDKIQNCESDDAETMMDIAHQLRGVSSLCGFSELYTTAEDIEESCKAGKNEPAFALAASMRQTFDRNVEVLMRIYPVEYKTGETL